MSRLPAPGMAPGLRRLLRYGTVGVASTATYFAAYVTAIIMAGAPVWLAACFGFAAGTGVSYLGNAVWTYQQKAGAQSALRFACVVAASFTVNLVVAAALAWAGVHYLVIFCIEAVVLTSLNYAGHTLWTFRPAPAE